MAETKNTKKAQDTKAVGTKATETKRVETPKKEVAKNEEKKNTFISIEEVTKMYQELGIKCANPTAKGNYRIMGSKSSLNIKPTKGYFIYTSDSDLDLIKASKVTGKDLVVEEGTNKQDKSRPNTIICTTVETLKAILKVYATNPLNQVVTEAK